METVLFSSDLVTVGTFECSGAHPSFPRTGPTAYNAFALVRSPVWMRRGHGPYTGRR